MSKNTLRLIIRLTITAAILAAIYFAIDPNEFFRIVKTIQIKWTIYALLLILFIRILMALRWHYILSIYKIPAQFSEILSVIFISNSIGHILPSGIGTDIIRGYQVAKNHGNTANVSATIILDRLIGLYSMLCLALIGALVAFIFFAGGILLPAILAVVNLVFIAGLVVLHIVCSRAVKLEMLQQKLPKKIWNALTKVITATSDIQNIKKVFLPIFTISILVQLIRCAVFYFLYQGIAYPIEFAFATIFIPIVFVVMLIPISIGGLGLRESTLILAFSQFGIPAEANVTAGLLFHFLQILVLIPGLLLFLFQGSSKVRKI